MAALLGQDRCPARAADRQARRPTLEVVRANTELNAKRQRGDEAEGCEQAHVKRRRQRDTHVRFHCAARVRDVEEEDAAGYCAHLDHEAAQRGGAVRDHHVETKLVDGPNLISQVVSDLLNGIPLPSLRDAEAIMCSVHTTLLQHGWTSILSAQELDLLGQTYSHVERLEEILIEKGSVAILPGAFRLKKAILPWMQQLKLGIQQARAALRIAVVQAQEMLQLQLAQGILLGMAREFAVKPTEMLGYA
jgi:hypothetical protein